MFRHDLMCSVISLRLKKMTRNGGLELDMGLHWAECSS